MKYIVGIIVILFTILKANAGGWGPNGCGPKAPRVDVEKINIKKHRPTDKSIASVEFKLTEADVKKVLKVVNYDNKNSKIPDLDSIEEIETE